MTIRLLIPILLLHAPIYAEDAAFLGLPDSAITLRAPDAWSINKMDGELSIFPPDNPEHGSPSRIHLARPREAANSLQRAIAAELDSITKRSPESGNSREHYKGNVAVKSASGLQGLRADFHFEKTINGITTKRYQIIKYYFLDEKGKVFKICAHIYGDEAKFKRYENLILDNLISDTEARKHDNADDICHFNKAEIPANEARLLELARVTEFRCDSILPKGLINKSYKDTAFMNDTQFIAERYQGGKCVSRQCFSFGMHSDNKLSEGTYKGIISFGWHLDDQKLVGVHDTGYFHQTGFAKLPAFNSETPRVWAFFKDSRAEPRVSNNGLNFDLYPILGIRGSKAMTFNGMTISGRTGDIFALSSEQLASFFKNQPDAVIVYLYFGAGQPDLGYDKKEAELAGTGQPATAPQLKPEGGDKPQPESEERSR